MKQARPVPVQHLGIILDKPPEEVPENTWTGGENVAFADGATYRTGGYTRFADPLLGTGPIFALNVIVGPEAYWLYCTTNKVYVTDGATKWDITPATGLSSVSAGDWSACILNGIPCLNNRADPPFYWDLQPTNACKPLPGWPSGARCKALRATKYHLMALNIQDGTTQYGSQVWWSNGAQAGNLPTEWTPTASNDAGDAVLGDSPGDIIDGLALRDAFIVYKAFSTYIMQYVAGTYVFTSRKLFETTGIQALNCVVEANGTHYVFTGTDVIHHDGQSYRSVADEKVKKALVQSIDPAKVSLSLVESRLLNNQIWVCIAENGHPWLNKAYILDLDTTDWGVRVLPEVACVARGIVSAVGLGNSWDVQTTTWDNWRRFWDQQSYSPTQDSMLMVDSVNSRLYAVDAAETADGAPVYAYVEKLGAILGDFATHKVVTGIVPRIEGTPGDTLSITLGGQAWFDTPIVWGTARTFVIGQDRTVDDIVEGRLLSVRIEGTTEGVWKLYRYAVTFADQGEY